MYFLDRPLFDEGRTTCNRVEGVLQLGHVRVRNSRPVGEHIRVTRIGLQFLNLSSSDTGSPTRRAPAR